MSMSNLGPEETDDASDFLNTLEEELKVAAGQTIAWLSVENQVVAWRLPGPHKTEDAYFLNIGVLTSEPKLEERATGTLLPVDKAVRVPLWNPLDQELSWDMNLSDVLGRGVSSPEPVQRPEIFVRNSNGLAVWSGAKRGFVDIPRPAIGNESVASLFDRHELEQIPKVVEVIDMLRASIVEQAA